MAVRRTTVAAPEEDLAVLAAEAHRQGVSLSRKLGELVSNEASAIRLKRRPRLGTFSAPFSIAEEMEKENPAARPYRS